MATGKRVLNFKDKECEACGRTFKPASGVQRRCPQCKADGIRVPTRTRKRAPRDEVSDLLDPIMTDDFDHVAPAEDEPESVPASSLDERSMLTEPIPESPEPARLELDLRPLEAYIQTLVEKAIDQRFQALFARMGREG